MYQYVSLCIILNISSQWFHTFFNFQPIWENINRDFLGWIEVTKQNSMEIATPDVAGTCQQRWMLSVVAASYPSPFEKYIYNYIYILYKSQSFVWSMVNRFPILCSVRFCFVCLFVLKSLGLVLCANTTPQKKLLNTWFESCFLIVNCNVWIPWFSGI